MGNQKVNPVAIVGAVVVLLGFLYFVYTKTFAPKGPPPEAAAAEHKDMAEFYKNQGKVGAGGH